MERIIGRKVGCLIWMPRQGAEELEFGLVWKVTSTFSFTPSPDLEFLMMPLAMGQIPGNDETPWERDQMTPTDCRECVGSALARAGVRYAADWARSIGTAGMINHPSAMPLFCCNRPDWCESESKSRLLPIMQPSAPSLHLSSDPSTLPYITLKEGGPSALEPRLTPHFIAKSGGSNSRYNDGTTCTSRGAL